MAATLGLTAIAENLGNIENEDFSTSIGRESSSERSHLRLVKPEGQLKVHTAPYRASYPVVLSEALRAAGLGSEVMVAQFLKGGVNQGPKGTVNLCGQLEWLRPDLTCCVNEKSSINSIDLEPNRSQEISAVNEIWLICKDRMLSGSIDQLVLDEIGLAISLGYLQEDEIISSLEKRSSSTDVILTGPSIPSGVLNMADQITELRCCN